MSAYQSFSETKFISIYKSLCRGPAFVENETVKLSQSRFASNEICFSPIYLEAIFFDH